MADAYARMTGRIGALTVHQGCGLTNAMTGITEAAKSRTPLLVLAAEAGAGAVTSNFRIDQDGLVSAVGAVPMRVTSGISAVAEAARAYRTALYERRTVLLNLPLDVQALEVPEDALAVPAAPVPTAPAPSPEAVAALVEVLAGAARPVLVAGRGARGAGPQLRALARSCGALLATSAVAKGLFHDDPWSLDISGGFASPLAAELISGADVVVGFGCALNMWTTRHGRLIAPDATVAQVDLDPSALGAHRPVHLGIVGDSALTAAAAASALAVADLADEDSESRDDVDSAGYRTAWLRERIGRERRWRDVPYEDWGGGGRIDPRTLTIGLDDVLPAQRVVAVDSGNFMGYPSMFLDVPDEQGFCFTQAFQSVGLGLATAIGAALARPDRLPVAALGDGGALMSASELETVVRLGLAMVVVVYDDAAYGAEVHHFAGEERLDTVTFPETDFSAIGRGYGYQAVTVRRSQDLDGVRRWVDGARQQPLLVDAKVAAPRGSWWLEEAFRGH
jgi:thiamine pyrophosphate-dependent acetolactate synthase large subunit-like protein